MQRTPLYHIHQQSGGKLINFAGWEMPVQYTGILTEHQNVREKCGLFDVSHMGEIYIQGPDACSNLQYLLTNDVARLQINQVLYTPMCAHNGGIIDDLLVYRLGKEQFLLVVNAANTTKDFNWIQANCSGDLLLEDRSTQYAQLALQGPLSRDVLQQLTALDLTQLKYYWFVKGEVGGEEVILSRTGYTGELGYELYLDPGKAERLWQEIMRAGRERGIMPIGLGARNTLRLEKKFCLYGNDIDRHRHPLEAGLAWTVKFEKGDFIGREVLLQYQAEGYRDRLIGFKLVERGIARHGYKIQYNGEDIGVVTSGSFSPTLEENIGLGYIEQQYVGIGNQIEVVIRRNNVKAELVKTPFV